MAAALSGATMPQLLLPSVSRMMLLLLALPSLMRLMAVAMPSPMAVPSSIKPRFTSWMAFISVALSIVIGTCVKLSPAKITTPMLSCSRPATNCAATSLAASSRLGLKSRASILVLTSIASTMSVPSTSLSLHELTSCGRHRIITVHATAAIYMANTT